MTFKEYVDSLCKQGIIDGNIAERLCGLHNSESADPKSAITKKVLPILEEMWKWPVSDGDINAGAIHTFADQIDDIISQ